MDKAGGLTRAAARIKAETRPNRGNVGTSARGRRFNLAPPAEDRVGSVKLTIMLPPDLYEAVMRETARRATEDAARNKEHRKKNHQLSDVVRDALTEYLKERNGEPGGENFP